MKKYFCQNCGSQLDKSKDKSISSIGYCAKCKTDIYLNPKPVASAIITLGNRILLSKRKVAVGYGKWCMPGGFLENGELPDNAAKREVLEEIGVKIKIDRFLGFETFISPYYKKTMLLDCQFVGHIISGTPKPLHETSAIKWFEIDKIPYKDFAFLNNINAVKRYLKIRARSSIG